MQVRIARYHITPVRMTKSRTPKTSYPGEDMEQQKLLHTLLGMQNGAVPLGDSLAVSYKTKLILPIQSSNHTPDTQRSRKLTIHTKTCMWTFTAALFTIVKTWKQPRCPLVGEWINKLWYIQIMEYYSTLERHVHQSMQRQGGNLNACYWAKEANLKWLHTTWVQLYEILEKAKLYEDSKKKKKSVVSRNWGRGKGWIDGTQRIFKAVKIFCKTL